MNTRASLLLGLVLLVPACGGGGGGGGGAPPVGGGSDPSFNFAKGFGALHSIPPVSVKAIAPAGAGKYYVAGAFTTINDTRSPGLVRLNADGSIDATFDVGEGFDSTVFCLAVAPDGKLYAGGVFQTYDGAARARILRLNIDGTRDDTFAIGTGFNSTVRALAVATDGTNDLYVAGSFTSYQGIVGRNRLARLNDNGTFDAGFITGTGPDLDVYALAAVPNGIDLATDGDVYVGGSFAEYGTTLGVNRIVRLNVNGSIDTGFDAGTGFNNRVDALVVDAAGDVYAAGTFLTYKTLSQPRLVRLNSDGMLDGGFAVGTGPSGPAHSLALATDGSGDVFVGGEFGGYNGLANTARLARLNSNGTADAAFVSGTGFTGGLGGDLAILAVAPDAGGDVLAGGWFTIFDGTGVDSFARVNADGTLDATTRLGSGFNYGAKCVLPASDGSGDLFVGGDFEFYDGAAHERMIRLNNDGTVDASFNAPLSFNSDVLVMAHAPDGSGDLYAGGTFTAKLLRLNGNGTVDGGFTADAAVNNTVRSVVAAPDGSGDIYVAGDFAEGIIRLNSDGTPDTAAVGTGFNNDVLGLVLAPDATGDLIAIGNFASYNGTASAGILRLNGDLTIDTVAVGTGFNNTPQAVCVSGTNVYVGGIFTQYNGVGSSRLIRLSGALVRDGSFDPQTSVSKTIGAPTVYQLLATASGRLYVVGEFETYRGVPASHIVAINPDGSRDAAFDVGTGFTDPALAMVLGTDANADLYVAGYFFSYKNKTVDRIVALNADGTID